MIDLEGEPANILFLQIPYECIQFKRNFCPICHGVAHICIYIYIYIHTHTHTHIHIHIHRRKLRRIRKSNVVDLT